MAGQFGQVQCIEGVFPRGMLVNLDIRLAQVLFAEENGHCGVGGRQPELFTTQRHHPVLESVLPHTGRAFIVFQDFGKRPRGHPQKRGRFPFGRLQLGYPTDIG